MTTTQVTIARDELFSQEVEQAVARQRALSGGAAPAPARVSPLRRVLFSSLLYMPVAGMLGATTAYGLLEPYINDAPRVAGTVALINADPFDATVPALTIGNTEVLVDPDTVRTTPGPHGEPGFATFEEIQVGTVVEVVGVKDERKDHRIVASAIRRTTPEAAAVVQSGAERASGLALALFFPIVGTLVALAMLLVESISRRNWSRMVHRGLVGSALAALFSFLAMLPAGLVFSLAQEAISGNGTSKVAWMVFITGRSVAWALIGAGLGLGMNLSRATRAELRNSCVGGALGGAFGGLFFDPVDIVSRTSLQDGLFHEANLSRLIGTCAIGLSVGVFIALLEHLTREAWLRVRTGPLAGKAFVLYRSPTTIGSSPTADIYLFKDAGIDPHHASIHRVGQTYEIEDQESRQGVVIGGRPVRRQRLASGDEIVIGGTVLEFEERARRPVLKTDGPILSPAG